MESSIRDNLKHQKRCSEVLFFLKSVNLFFRLLYCDECLVTESNAFDLMNAAKVLSFGHLEQKCSEFIRWKVSKRNVGFFTGKALHSDAKESLKVCLDFFKKHTSTVLNAVEFRDISHDVLLFFSENKGDNCSESRFFVACVRWALAECHRQNREGTLDNFRKVLGEELIKKIIYKKTVMDKSLITDENLFELMHVAKIFGISDLESDCSEFIQKKLTVNNVGFFTSEALHFEAKDSLKVSQDFFKKNTLKVLNTEEFLDIPHEVLENFCNNKSDDCSEARFFKACFDWSKAECKRQKLKVTHENLRNVLGNDLISKIDYEKMGREEFIYGVVPT